MSYVWDRSPIMSNEELEELFMKPAIQERTLQPRREMNYSAFLAILGYLAAWIGGGYCFWWMALNGHFYVNRVVNAICGVFGQ